MGPLSGRRAGYCAGHDAPGSANPVPGRGLGRGWGYGRSGGGRGWRRRFYATGRPGRAERWYGESRWAYAPTPTEEQELEGLRREAEWLKGQLDVISQRVEKLEGK